MKTNGWVTEFLFLFCALSYAAPVEPVKAHEDGVWKIAFSAEGDHFLTAGGDGVVKTWWTECFCGLASFRHDSNFRVWDAAFFPDHRIVSTSQDGSIYVWQGETGEKVQKIEGHTLNAPRVRVLPDGSRFFTACSDGFVKAWDGKTYTELSSIKTKSPVGIVPLGGTPEHWLTVGLNGVLLWNLAEQKVERTFSESPYYFVSEPISPTQVLIGGNPSQGGPLQILDTEKKEIVQTFDSVPGFFWQVDASRDGKWIGASAYKSKAYVWERATGKLVYSSDEKVGETISLSFFPEGRAIIIGGSDGTIQMARF